MFTDPHTASTCHSSRLQNLQGSSVLQELWNTLFWCSIGLLCCLVGHALARFVFIWRRWRMPMLLEVGGWMSGRVGR